MRSFIAKPSLKYNTEFRMRHRDGSYRRILSQAALLFNEEGIPIRMLGSHVDVTEQRREEGQRHQAQKMEAVGRLAGGVAHDFNNMLTVIMGYGDMLAAAVDSDPNLSRVVTEINRAAERAAGLTRQLLAFSRQQVMVPKVLDLNVVIGDINRMLQRLIGEDVEISIIQSKALDWVKADPGQIEQVIVNLAVNARDAMPTGGRLTIETANVELDQSYAGAHAGVTPGPYVMLAVSDTGTGMDERTRAHIFEPFFTTKEVGKGTGLGLSTVYGIVRQSGGHIWLYSEAGRGTTFKIYLPKVDRLREPDQTHTPERKQVEVPHGSETVLLVKDDASLRLFVSTVLRECGYQILEAQNGIEAVSIAEQFAGRIDFDLTDVVMPKMGGRELSAALGARREGIKILYMSGYTRMTPWCSTNCWKRACRIYKSHLPRRRLPRKCGIYWMVTIDPPWALIHFVSHPVVFAPCGAAARPPGHWPTRWTGCWAEPGRTDAIADTSPLCYLILVGEIDVLPKLYRQVLVPSAVISELFDEDAGGPPILDLRTRESRRRDPKYGEVGG
jgi:two-component system cell cycle sensor histidine kinase/response regulator CckA